MQKFFIALIVSAAAVIHSQAAELEDVSEKPIPDKPAAGKVQMKEFKVKDATPEDGSLKLWQGEDIFSHLEQFFKCRNNYNKFSDHRLFEWCFKGNIWSC